MKPALLIFGVLFLVSPVLSVSYLRQKGEMRMRSEDEAAKQARNSSALGVVLGEFRTNFSDLIFIKTEKYLHNGISYMPHLDTSEMAASGDVVNQTETPRARRENIATMSPEELSARFEQSLSTPEMRETAHLRPGEVLVEEHGHGHGEASEACDDPNCTHDHSKDAAACDDPNCTHGHGHDHDHAACDDPNCTHDHGHVATIIRTPDGDFRGFIGMLEREVKPWQDPRLPHIHTGGTELLPWYRVATLADPHNIRNYMIGAWWLKRFGTETQLKEAEQFLEEGIRNNPRAFELYLMRGYVSRDQDRDEDAAADFHKAAEIALEIRPRYAEWLDEDDLTEEQQAKVPTRAKDGTPYNHYTEDSARAAVTMSVLMVREKEGLEAALRLTEDYASRTDEMFAIERLLRSLRSAIEAGSADEAGPAPSGESGASRP